MSWRGVGFDLFETLVRVDWSVLPRLTLEGKARPSTAPHLLELLLPLLPDLSAERLDQIMFQSWTDLQDSQQVLEYREILGATRFDAILQALGLPPGRDRLSLGRQLSERHHRVVESTLRVPAAERALLDWCSQRGPVGLVSNYDDGPSARRILEAHDLQFQVIVISAELGRRKPHPSLFSALAKGLDLEAKDCLFVGDDPVADIEGAQSAGMEAAWLDRYGQRPPNPMPSMWAKDAELLLDKLKQGA